MQRRGLASNLTEAARREPLQVACQQGRDLKTTPAASFKLQLLWSRPTAPTETQVLSRLESVEIETRPRHLAFEAKTESIKEKKSQRNTAHDQHLLFSSSLLQHKWNTYYFTNTSILSHFDAGIFNH